MSREKWSRRDPDYRAGYRLGRVQSGRASNGGGCALWLFALAPGLIALTGWAGGVLLTWWAG